MQGNREADLIVHKTNALIQHGGKVIDRRATDRQTTQRERARCNQKVRQGSQKIRRTNRQVSGRINEGNRRSGRGLIHKATETIGQGREEDR